MVARLPRNRYHWRPILREEVKVQEISDSKDKDKDRRFTPKENKDKRQPAYRLRETEKLV